MAFLAFGSVHAIGGLSTLHEAAYAEMGVPSFLADRKREGSSFES
jgi:hypothetical protein